LKNLCTGQIKIQNKQILSLIHKPQVKKIYIKKPTLTETVILSILYLNILNLFIDILFK